MLVMGGLFGDFSIPPDIGEGGDVGSIRERGGGHSARLVHHTKIPACQAGIGFYIIRWELIFML